MSNGSKESAFFFSRMYSTMAKINGLKRRTNGTVAENRVYISDAKKNECEAKGNIVFGGNGIGKKYSVPAYTVNPYSGRCVKSGKGTKKQVWQGTRVTTGSWGLSAAAGDRTAQLVLPGGRSTKVYYSGLARKDLTQKADGTLVGSDKSALAKRRFNAMRADEEWAAKWNAHKGILPNPKTGKKPASKVAQAMKKAPAKKAPAKKRVTHPPKSASNDALRRAHCREQGKVYNRTTKKCRDSKK